MFNAKNWILDIGYWKLKRFIYICFLVFGFWFLSSPFAVNASSQQTVTISPALLHLKFVPGMSTTKTITIKNQSSEPILFRVYVKTLNAQNDDYLSWFSLSVADQMLVVPDFSEKNLQVAIKIPKYAPPAGYYAQVLFEPLVSNHLRNSLQITPVFSVPLLADVLELQKNGDTKQSVTVKNIELKGKIQSQILKFAFNKIFKVPAAHALAPSDDGVLPMALMEKSPLNFTIALKNDGKYLAYSKGKISIYDLNNKKIASANLPETSLLPDEEKKIDVLTKIEPQGIFSFAFPKRLKAIIETETSRNEFIFWAFSLKKSVLTLVIAISSLLLITLRRRICKACKVLIAN